MVADRYAGPVAAPARRDSAPAEIRSTANR
jgi:hypothetical protein